MKEFTHIKKNIYIDRKKYAFCDDDAYLCECKKKPVSKKDLEILDLLDIDHKKEDEFFGCGKTCVNRLVSSECVEHLCPAGVSCRNRRFQQHLYSEVYPVKTENRGWGLCAGEFLPKGTFVMQYIGEIYSIDSDYGISKLKEYKNKTCTYLMEISKKEVIDPTTKGNCARFINHSCEPNCETQKWHVLGEICVGIFTLRDIHEGEELTFNYGFNILKTTFQKCLCGTPSCKGYLGIVSQNDVPRGPDHSILCDLCKIGCKNSEKVLVCESCKKVSHKNCVKKQREKLALRAEDDREELTLMHTGNFYICLKCIRNKAVSGATSITTSMSALSIFNPIKKDKKSSQQLIKEYKSRKKNKPSHTEESMSVTESVDHTQTNLSASREAIVNFNDTKEEPGIVNNFDVRSNSIIILNNTQTVDEPNNIITLTPALEITNNKQKEEEVEETTETIEVEESDLKKIRHNLKNLSNIGARLFWDYRQQSNLTNGIEIKITGTPSQIEKVKIQIQKLKQEKEVCSDYFSVTFNVPQIYVRKIIGHQNRNLISYRSKYNVEIDYNYNLMTDDIFPIYETSAITIKGKENFVKSVENEIRKTVDNLKVVTIFLMPADYNFIKTNICQLKTMIDPADMRLRKREYKIDREIKHSFYYVPCTNKDLVIIGFENEINKAQRIIREFLLRQNTLEHNYSLCFLCPVFFLNQIHRFQDENASMLSKRNLLIKVYDPVFSRKHLNIYMEGKWKDIIEVKNQLMRFLNENDKNSKKKNSIADFQQYTYNQEHKLISKNLRKFFLQESQIIKNWDLISDEVWSVWENSPSSNPQNLNPLLKNFIDGPNSDTMLNYLLHLPSGSYNSVFNCNKLDLTKELIYYVEEALDSYRSKKKEKRSNSREVAEKIEASKIIEFSPIKNKDSMVVDEDLNIQYIQNIHEEDLVENLTDEENEPNENFNIKLESINTNTTVNYTQNINSLTINQGLVNPILNQGFNNTNNNFTNQNVSLFGNDIDCTKNTLINKLTEIKPEIKPAINECQCNSQNSNNSVKSIDLSKANNIKPYEITVSPDDLTMLLKNNPNSSLSQPGFINSESMNISYNFSNINQMNININISSFPKDLITETKDKDVEGENQFTDDQDKNSLKGKKDSKYLKKKTRSERSLSPPYLKRQSGYYKPSYEKDRRDRDRYGNEEYARRDRDKPRDRERDRDRELGKITRERESSVSNLNSTSNRYYPSQSYKRSNFYDYGTSANKYYLNTRRRSRSRDSYNNSISLSVPVSRSPSFSDENNKKRKRDRVRDSERKIKYNKYKDKEREKFDRRDHKENLSSINENLSASVNMNNIPNDSVLSGSRSRSRSLSSISYSSDYEPSGHKLRGRGGSYKSYPYVHKANSSSSLNNYNSSTYKRSFNYGYSRGYNYSSLPYKNYSNRSSIKTYYNTGYNRDPRGFSRYDAPRDNFSDTRRRHRSQSESRSPSRSNLRHVKEFLEIRKSEDAPEDGQQDQPVEVVELKSCLKKPAA
jgi:hypothetical protein